MPEITDEEAIAIKEILPWAKKKLEDFAPHIKQFKTIDLMLARIESEREKKDVEIGPDHIGGVMKHTNSIEIELLRHDISRYLKGRMECWKRQEGAGRVVHEIKTLHEALCGEVGDET